MEYRCISADCHIDLNWIPHDLFVNNSSAALKDRMPYVIDEPGGPRWTTKTGLNLGFANGKGAPAALGSGGASRYVPGTEHRLDRMASTGLYSDGAKGIFRPTTPNLRLQDQDRDGVQAEVLYGLLGAGNKLKDHEAAVEFFRIYNDWLSDFCKFDRKRFVGLASIPSHSSEVAVAEIKRVARAGVGGLDVSFSWDMTPLWDPFWDPLWRAAAEANLPVHFHTIGPPPEAPLREDLPELSKMASGATKAAGFPLFMSNILGSIIFSGALERYPTLRIVLGESGIGWIPYALARMDMVYVDRYKSLGLGASVKLKPSEYWRRQCRATFSDDQAGAALLDILGVETVMWASDYPHRDGIFPDSQEFIKQQFSRFPDAIQRKITCENAGKFYGLIPA